MCGVAGFFSVGGAGPADAERVVLAMANALEHRGPDDVGIWSDTEAGILLAHRRLSIVDLSAAGHQPMVSRSGRYVIAYNGEIYNHARIREKLEAEYRAMGVPFAWHGHSDTETLVAAIEQWGFEQALQACIGMFAIAVWDRSERRLLLARDRLGEKPLYYGWQGQNFLFGSELKALTCHPAFGREIDPEARSRYLQFGYIPEPRSIWRGIQKLTPGTWVAIASRNLGETPDPRPYWTLQSTIDAGKRDPFRGNDADAIDALEQCLKEAVAGQMVADVPLGAFLSGGVDSSVVVALMQAQSARPIKTFTIGFDDESYDESAYAGAVAKHLGTDHTVLRVSSDEARNIIPKLPSMYDEPFGDASAIPTHLVAELARRDVTVALSGDGGDELFGGYTRYFNAGPERLWHNIRRLPTGLRGGMRALMQSGTSTTLIAALDSTIHKLAGPQSKSGIAYQDLLCGLLACDGFEDLYALSVSPWRHPPVADGVFGRGWIDNRNWSNQLTERIERMMAADTLMYLPGDILTKVDRAAMAVSLETRVPLLDRRVVELAWAMPFSMKVRHGQGKWLLRQLLYRYVPAPLIDRPKKGFGVPVDHWIRDSLRDWADSLLTPDKLAAAGLDPKPVRLRYEAHQNGVSNWRDSLWTILMYQSWHEAHG